MTGDGYLVSLDGLHHHASRVESVAEDVSLAADAARQVNLSDGSFGLLCSFLPPLVNGAETETGNALQAAAQTLQAMVTGLLAMAESYGATDDAVATTLQGMVPQ